MQVSIQDSLTNDHAQISENLYLKHDPGHGTSIESHLVLFSSNLIFLSLSYSAC